MSSLVQVKVRIRGELRAKLRRSANKRSDKSLSGEIADRLARSFEANTIGYPTWWYSIETAPKDGLPILVYDRGWSTQFPIIVRWYNYSGGAWRDEDGDPYLPSHWMPLPSPPETPAPVAVSEARQAAE